MMLHLLNNALFIGDFCLIGVVPRECTAFVHGLDF